MRGMPSSNMSVQVTPPAGPQGPPLWNRGTRYRRPPRAHPMSESGTRTSWNMQHFTKSSATDSICALLVATILLFLPFRLESKLAWFFQDKKHSSWQFIYIQPSSYSVFPLPLLHSKDFLIYYPWIKGSKISQGAYWTMNHLMDKKWECT